MRQPKQERKPKPRKVCPKCERPFSEHKIDLKVRSRNISTGTVHKEPVWECPQ